MKIGIVVPFSWSYWGGVVEHAENQAAALRDRGHEVQILMGHDPPGRADAAPAPAQRPPRRPARRGSSRSAARSSSRRTARCRTSSSRRARCSGCGDVLAEERFDVVHLHEPMTPVDLRRRRSPFASARSSRPGTRRATSAGCAAALPVWGFLIDRVDARIAVSRMAAESAERWLGPGFEIVPNGVVVPEHADPSDREHQVVFIGRHDARKGLPVLLRAWPEIRRRDRRAAAADRHRPAAVPAAALAAALRRGRDRRARDRPQRRARRTSSRPPSSSSRRRSAGRASGWCSSRRSRRRRRWSPRTSPASPTSRCPTRRRSSRRATRRRSPTRSSRCSPTSRGGVAMGRAGARARRGALRLARRRAPARARSTSGSPA